MKKERLWRCQTRTHRNHRSGIVVTVSCQSTARWKNIIIIIKIKGQVSSGADLPTAGGLQRDAVTLKTCSNHWNFEGGWRWRGGRSKTAGINNNKVLFT